MSELEEPLDGVMVAIHARGTFAVWVRDDATAKTQADPLARWFCGAAYSMSSTWKDLTSHALVYALVRMNTLHIVGNEAAKRVTG